MFKIFNNEKNWIIIYDIWIINPKIDYILIKILIKILTIFP